VGRPLPSNLRVDGPFERGPNARRFDSRRRARAAIGGLVATALVIAFISGSVGRVAAQEGGVDVVKVRKNFYMIAGAGGNIGVQIGSDGVVLVNAGTAQATDQVLAALKKLTDLPIRYIINTDADADFVGGNEKLAKAGYTIFTNALGTRALPAR